MQTNNELYRFDSKMYCCMYNFRSCYGSMNELRVFINYECDTKFSVSGYKLFLSTARALL